MPTKTLYVTEEDATVWEQARALGAGSDDSMSRTVIEGLRALLRERRDNTDQARDDEKADLSVTVPRRRFTTLIDRDQAGFQNIRLGARLASDDESLLEGRWGPNSGQAKGRRNAGPSGQQRGSAPGERHSWVRGSQRGGAKSERDTGSCGPQRGLAKSEHHTR